MSPNEHLFRSITLFVPLVAVATLLASASAQTANPFVHDANGAVRQVSLAKVVESPADPASATGKPQLTVSIRYLLVDDLTRRTIYQSLTAGSIRHSAHAPKEPLSNDLQNTRGSDQVSKRLTTYGHSATCRLTAAEADKIVDLVSQTPTCTLSQAPSVFMQQNQVAEVNDTVQRPMVVDATLELGQVKPFVDVIEEGTRLRILANLDHPDSAAETSSDTIDLTVEFVDMRLVEWNSVEVFGLQEGATTLQHPICSSTTVITTDQLAVSQLLLIDPHIKRNVTIDIEPTSMLSKLPVVGKRLTTTESRSVQNHLMVLIKPSIFSQQ